MAKEIDDLFRDFFGTKSPQKNTPTQKAESYLQRAKGIRQDLDTVDQAHQDFNMQLEKQLEELKRMSSELDFDRIEQEVQKDFGVSPKTFGSEEKAAVKKKKDQRPEADRFADMLPKLQTELIGQDDFLKELVIAFKRPYIMGWDRPKGVRNAMLVHGVPNSGRHSAVRLIAEQMFGVGLLNEEEPCLVDLALYPGATEERLWLQDLYSALLKGGVIIFEHYEECNPAFLRQLSELIMTGTLRLSSRYVMQKGNLVDAGTALAPDTVGSFDANGCYFVILSAKGKNKLAEAFGAKLVDALGDDCETAPFTQEVLLKIAEKKFGDIIEKAEKQLGFTIPENKEVYQILAGKCSPKSGVGAILDSCEKYFRALAQYKLEKDAPAQEVQLFCEDEHLFAVLNGAKTDLLSLLPEAYRGEVQDVRAAFDRIVGLDEIKDYILSLEENYRVQKMRKAQGLPVSGVSMHMIFTGNPGTGKTTIARLVSQYLKAIGVLSGGQLVEVSRGDLVGKYVGHTAPQTMKIIKSALGGVLFIDEAYSLFRGKEDSFGLEAIDTLVKGMEDNREDLVVILAGYTKEMETFLTANSGLSSRFPNMIEFPDYTGEELVKIAELNADSRGYRIEEKARASLLDYFCVIQAMDDRRSGNGRLARNIIEQAILAQSRRVLDQPGAPLDLLQNEDFDLFM